MARTSDEINADLAAAFERMGREAVKATRAITAGMIVGTAYNHHRAGRQVEAAKAIAKLTQTERDQMHVWARWLLGDDLE